MVIWARGGEDDGGDRRLVMDFSLLEGSGHVRQARADTHAETKRRGCVGGREEMENEREGVCGRATRSIGLGPLEEGKMCAMRAGMLQCG